MMGLQINVQKTKLLKVGRGNSTGTIVVGGNTEEEVEEFCYLGSVLSSDSSCDKEIRTRIGKANTTFGRLNNIWRDKKLNIKIKSRLYETLVLSTVQYGAETWPMTITNMKKLEAAHHKWQRRILGITWKDMVTNDEVGKRSRMGKLEDILRKKRLRWLGHLHRMPDDRITKQSMEWKGEGKRKRGRPRKNWKTTIIDDLKNMEMSWQDAEQIAEERTVWRSCVALCAEGTWTD